MRNRLLSGVLLAAILIVPSLARAEEVLLPPRPILFQSDSSNDRDSLWNGVLIAGGIGVGALVDGLMSRRDNPVRGVQVSWRF
jgi:hypothetical protein